MANIASLRTQRATSFRSETEKHHQPHSGGIMDANDALVMKALVDEIIVGDTGIEIHCKCGITIEQEYVK